VIGVEAEINELEGDGSQYYDVIGLAGAIYGLSFVGEDFDPTSGEHQAASNIIDLANILVSYQLPSGGFTWTATATGVGDETVQETSYAILALNQIDPTTFNNQINNAALYLRSIQLGTGGWENYQGYGENNEITAEALWALTKENVNIPEIVFGAKTTPSNSSIVKSGLSQIKVEFDQDVLHDGSNKSANNVNNYLLIEAGVNGTFDTASCAVPGGPSAAQDDIQIAIDTVVYDASGPFISTLTVNGGNDLPEGKYRLFVCGTTSIENLYGIELNDGVSDSTIEFTVSLSTSSSTTTATSSKFELPSTGFAMNQFTNLPTQLIEKAYSSSGLVLQIPDLNLSLDIVGVPQVDNSWDTSWLGQNVGWLNGSAFPTWAGNTVLTGHVWNNTNTPGVFANIKELGYGQIIQIINNGEVYTYQVVSNQLINNNQIKLAFSHEKFDTITLLTCENYSEMTQTYQNRRMIKAVLVSVE
jgi:LPXTG-site transpeptidase (sortase) family protein